MPNKENSKMPKITMLIVVLGAAILILVGCNKAESVHENSYNGSKPTTEASIDKPKVLAITKTIDKFGNGPYSEIIQSNQNGGVQISEEAGKIYVDRWVQLIANETWNCYRTIADKNGNWISKDKIFLPYSDATTYIKANQVIRFIKEYSNDDLLDAPTFKVYKEVYAPNNQLVSKKAYFSQQPLKAWIAKAESNVGDAILLYDDNTGVCSVSTLSDPQQVINFTDKLKCLTGTVEGAYVDFDQKVLYVLRYNDLLRIDLSTGEPFYGADGQPKVIGYVGEIIEKVPDGLYVFHTLDNSIVLLSNDLDVKSKVALDKENDPDAITITDKEIHVWYQFDWQSRPCLKMEVIPKL